MHRRRVAQRIEVGCGDRRGLLRSFVLPLRIVCGPLACLAAGLTTPASASLAALAVPGHRRGAELAPIARRIRLSASARIASMIFPGSSLAPRFSLQTPWSRTPVGVSGDNREPTHPASAATIRAAPTVNLGTRRIGILNCSFISLLLAESRLRRFQRARLVEVRDTPAKGAAFAGEKRACSGIGRLRTESRRGRPACGACSERASWRFATRQQKARLLLAKSG